jgi:peroxiredoxin
MKKYLLLLLLLLNFKLFSQATFELNGVIRGVDSGFVQMWVSKTDTICSVLANRVPIIDGKFKFQGHLAHPYTTVFVIKSQEVFETEWFYIDTGKQIVTISVDSVVKLTSSSLIFDEFTNQFKPKMALIDNKRSEWKRNYAALADKYKNDIPLNEEDSMQVLYNSIKHEKDLILMNYVKKYPFSYLGLMELSSSIDGNNYTPIYDSCFLYMNRELKTKQLGAKIYKKLDVARLTVEGSTLPSFPISDTSSQILTLNKNLLKEYTLCDFWFNSCGYCIKQFPKLNDIYIKWRGKGFEIIGISTDKKRFEANWRGAIKKYQLSWPQYWDIDGLQAEKLLIRSFPTNFLLDKTGKIVAKNISPNQLEIFLQSNLK